MRKILILGSFYLTCLAWVLIVMGFIPWLTSAKPIAIIETYSLDNLPPPNDALSFAINHGSAIYYNYPIPKEAPLLVTTIIVFLLAFSLILYLIGNKLAKMGYLETKKTKN